MAAQVIQEFLTDMPSQIQALKHFLARGDSESSARQAHGIRGCGGTVGALRVCAVATEMEANADVGDLASVSSQIDALESAFREFMQVYFAKIPAERN